MFIKSIEIQNFRRFETYSAQFDRSFTLLVGPNGSGKTSLLQAVFVGMKTALQRVGGHAELREEDVRRADTVDPGGSRWRTPIYPSSVRLVLEIDGEETLLLQQRTAIETSPLSAGAADHPQSISGYQTMALKMSNWLDPASHSPAPIFARFGASNSVTGSGRPSSVQQPFERKDEVWQRANSDAIDVTKMAQWFQYHELRTLQEGSSPVVYRVVRGAVLSAIHADDIKYVVRDNQLMVLHATQGWRPFDQLSDGQRRVAAIFCELALRCSALNSHLGEECLARSEGVVTIDELDLHLHPLWQRSIIADLRRVFPQIQFIAASHSPFLLQAAYEHGRVLDLPTGEYVEPTDQSIEDIAESVMGVDHPQRGRRFLELKERAQAFYELLERRPSNAEEQEALKLSLDDALAAFANDPAAAAWLEQRRLAAGH